MAITYRYVDYAGAFDEDLGESVRLGSIEGLVETAALGEVGNSSIALDDPDSDLGHAGDEIRGHKLLIVSDDAAPAGDRVLFAGLIGDRTYIQEASLNTGAKRRIKPALMDTNAFVDLRELRGSTWKRSAETAEARLVALLASPHFSGITDQGRVSYPKHSLDAVDYRGQRPSVVLNDIVKGQNWNWYAYWDEASGGPALHLANDVRSDDFASDLRLSNVATDVDSNADDGTGATKTYAVAGKAALVRSPVNNFSGVGIPYAKGTYYESDPVLAARFIARDGSAPDGNTKTQAQAQRNARRYLANGAEETDRIETAVIVPAAEVNAIRAGHLIECRFREFVRYASFSYFRVLRRTVAQPTRTDDRYRIGLSLAPASPFSCVGLSDVLADHATIGAAVSSVSGNVTWAHATFDDHWFGMVADDPASAIPIASPANANDGDAATFSVCAQQTVRHTGTLALDWTATLDAEFVLCSTSGTVAVGSESWQSGPPSLFEYWDGAAWQAAGGSLTYGSGSPRYWTFTFSEPITTTKLLWRYLFSGTGGIADLWAFNPLGTRVYDMLAYGEAV